MRFLIPAIIAAFLVILGVLTARSDPIGADHPFCMPWTDLRRQLADSYGEAPIGGGLVSATAAVQVLAPPGGETFTIVAVDTQGIACVIAAGTAWETLTILKGNPA